MIYNGGPEQPNAIQRPAADTSLVFSASGDSAQSAVAVVYTITNPPGVTFASGQTADTLPRFLIGAQSTRVPFAASFVFPDSAEGQVIVTGRVNEIGGGNTQFDETWVVPVNAPASAFQSLKTGITSFLRRIAGGVGIMLVAVGLSACHKLTDPPMTSAGVIRLAPTDSILLADGTTSMTIRADVDTFFKPLAKVDFTTSRGTFFPTGVTQSVLPNDSGFARVQLKSSADTGTAIVTATSVGITRSIAILLKPKVNRGVLNITAESNPGIGDGASIVSLRVDVDTLVRPVTKVDFTTTLGVFLGGTGSISVLPNDSGIARVQLKPPSDSSTAIVTATSASITRSLEIPFAIAPAQSMQVAGDSFTLKQGLTNAMTVTATLFRSIGAPSPGATVTFFADTGAARTGTFGQFSSKTITSTSNTFVSKYTAGQTAFQGTLSIWAVSSRGGVSVSDTVRVTVIP